MKYSDYWENNPTENNPIVVYQQLHSVQALDGYHP